MITRKPGGTLAKRRQQAELTRDRLRDDLQRLLRLHPMLVANHEQPKPFVQPTALDQAPVPRQNPDSAPLRRLPASGIDGGGRPRGAVRPTGAQGAVSAHDDAGRRVQEWTFPALEMQPPTRTITYTYNHRGERSATTTARSRQVSPSMDAVGRLQLNTINFGPFTTGAQTAISATGLARSFTGAGRCEYDRTLADQNRALVAGELLCLSTVEAGMKITRPVLRASSRSG